MKFVALSIATIASLLVQSSDLRAQWEPSPFEGESAKAAIGCSTRHTDRSYLCLVVRCEAPGRLGLHAELSSVELLGPIELIVDGRIFPATGHSSESGSPYTNRLDADVAPLVAAMKSGSRVVVRSRSQPLTEGYETISLRGSSASISAIEASCMSAGLPGSTATGTDLLTNSKGAVRIDGLNKTPGCAFAEESGRVGKVERQGVGRAISGFSFVGDRYGESYVNVDSLATSTDRERRLRTLEYLLTPGRRLSLGTHGCGAAGRIEKLVSATEIR